MSRLNIIDASFHYASKTFSRDQYVLLAFEQPEGRHLTFEEISTFIAERAGRIPELGKRIREIPGNLDYPRWIRDDALPSEKVTELRSDTWHELRSIVSGLVQHPVDAARAAWHVHVARNLDGVPHTNGRSTVVVFQVSHALVDGRGATHLARRLFGGAEPPLDEPTTHFSPRSAVPVAIGSALALPVRLAIARIAAWKARRDFAREHGSGPLDRDIPRPAIRGNADPTTPRAVHVIACTPGQFAHSGVSVTTMALTAVGVATERYLREIGDDVPSTLNALVPMALPEDAPWPAVNRVVNGTVDLHPDVDDLAERAARTRSSLSAGHAEVTDPLLLRWITAENRIPAPIHLAAQKRRRKAARATTGTPKTALSNVTVVSVHRGESNLALCGAPAVFSGGFPMLGPARSLSHGFYGLGDTVTVCITACPDAFPDHERYAQILENAVKDVTAACATQD